jgi:hypothetical protein
LSRNLRWSLGNPHEQPDLPLVAKYTRIQEARHFHAFYARTQIQRLDDGILDKALCNVFHQAPFAVPG